MPRKQEYEIMKFNFCNMSAVVNFQKVWTRFTIDKNGRYKEDQNFCAMDIEEPVERDNIHLCKKHSEEWLKGEI